MRGAGPAQTSLALRAICGLALVFAAMGAALFFPAGTLAWPAAWAFLAVFSGCGVAVTAALVRIDPALAERRMHGGPAAEREGAQKLVQVAAGLVWFGLLVVSGLDHRRRWFPLPGWVQAIGDALVAIGYVGVWRVFRENRHAGAIIAVEEGQRVVATGPYGRVRHPMYAASLVMMGGILLALGSASALWLVPPLLGATIWRLLLEERFLASNLSGYRDYAAKLRWRLLPGVF